MTHIISTIVIVAVLVMILYSLTGPKSMKGIAGLKVEQFANDYIDHELLPEDKVAVTQGIASVPTPTLTSMKIDTTDPSIPSVDGTKTSPKSMFMFAYNKCDINCCNESPYSCQGGCVCMTKSQRDFISSRGRNVHQDGCILHPTKK
jgi:hypothetical protein